MQFTCNDGVGRRSSATRSRSASLARWCLCSAPPLAYSANEHSLPTMIAPARPGKINGNATGSYASQLREPDRHRTAAPATPTASAATAIWRSVAPRAAVVPPAVTPLAAPVATGAVKRQQRLSAPPTPKQRPLRSIVRIGRFGSLRVRHLYDHLTWERPKLSSGLTGTRGVGPPCAGGPGTDSARLTPLLPLIVQDRAERGDAEDAKQRPVRVEVRHERGRTEQREQEGVTDGAAKGQEPAHDAASRELVSSTGWSTMERW